MTSQNENGNRWFKQAHVIEGRFLNRISLECLLTVGYASQCFCNADWWFTNGWWLLLVVAWLSLFPRILRDILEYMMPISLTMIILDIAADQNPLLQLIKQCTVDRLRVAEVPPSWETTIYGGTWTTFTISALRRHSVCGQELPKTITVWWILANTDGFTWGCFTLRWSFT